MYFLALAADYDETLAHGGTVDRATRAALARLKESGRRLLLVTGRELPDLTSVFGDLTLFDRVIAENGALLYDPGTREQRLLAEPPPALFVERLRERRVEPLSVGRCIVSTSEPEESAVLEEIHALGLELQIIFNKGSVMALPSGVNKASGVAAALADVGLSPHNVVAVGDAENDHALLHACGCGAAVANALSMLRESADVVLAGNCGAGVVELVERMLAEEEALIPAREALPVGLDEDGRLWTLPPAGGSVLIAGQPGTGKSALLSALAERMAERGYEFCVLDPKGDYCDLEHAVAVGDASTPPQTEEVSLLLERLRTNVVVDAESFTPADRPAYFMQLLPQIAAIRVRTGRPHWVLVDEAHLLLPAQPGGSVAVLPAHLPASILFTVHPADMSPKALASVHTVIALGDEAAGVVSSYCAAAGVETPARVPRPGSEEILFWRLDSDSGPRAIRAPRPRR
jgi:hydroxymethylpyrimidine pyrophosphatase-like HAD family hydrolase